ncbi:hypothetical protein fsci_10430 [Francisella sciaenopsi]|uniref:Uncharacterized protein n=1 Tax=Francisella sciaenopsi TaxID=3055034 RepID=A0ABQ6PF30_9GAMM
MNKYSSKVPLAITKTIIDIKHRVKDILVFLGIIFAMANSSRQNAVLNCIGGKFGLNLTIVRLLVIQPNRTVLVISITIVLNIMSDFL